MAFSAQTNVTSNSSTNASVDIQVSPASSIITATNLIPGGAATTGLTNVSNTGTVDEFYSISADWSADSFSDKMTAILANTLNISVSTGGTNLYDGTLAGLIDQPASPGRALTQATGNEDVEFSVSLPSTAGDIVNALDINVDFIFVATN